MGRLDRLTTRISQRTYGRLDAWFYESAGAAAVADIVGPRFSAAIGDAAIVLDVGCGGGVLTTRLAEDGRAVLGVDEAPSQVRRARRAGLRIARGGAEALPVRTASVDALVSSCSVKHWVDAARGMAECLRVLRPGAPIAFAEIDGASDRARLRAFAAVTRIPRALQPLYPTMAKPCLADPSPTAEQLAALLEGAGAVDVQHEQLADLPFVLAWGRRAS